VSKPKFKTIAILFLCLIAGIFVLRFLLNPHVTEAEWFNDSWSYRQAINISSHTAGETNVYIITTITIGSTAKAQADDGDFRFTNQSGTLLPYYISSGAGTTSVTFHVQISDFPAGPETVYAYYGNPTAPNGFNASDYSTQASNYSIGSYSSEEVGGGPVAYWKFDENVGTTAHDSSGNSNTGILINTPLWEPGESGSGLYLNGSSQYVTSTTAYANPVGFTLEAWFKTTTTSGGKIIGLGTTQIGSSTSYDRQIYMLNNGTITFDLNTTDISTTASYNNGVWHHVVGTQSATGGTKLYIDGILIGADPAGTTPESFTGYWRIGYDSLTGEPNPPSSFYFAGTIDDVKVYNYTRTASQIKQDYAAGVTGLAAVNGAGANLGSQSQKFLSDGLVGYWKMDENVGTTTADSSGNNGLGTFAAGSSAPGWSGGKFGTGTSFSVNDYISIGSTISSVYSLSLWYYPSNTAPQFVTFDSSAVNIGASVSTIYAVGISSPTIYVDSVRSTNIGTANTWHHLVITSPSPITGNQIYFGRTSSSFLNGRLDEIRLYNRTLTPNEIEGIYQWAPGPIAHWKFDENVGTTAYDSSGNGYIASWQGTTGSQWTSGKIGQAGKFNGSDNYLTSTISNPTQLTYEAWIKLFEIGREQHVAEIPNTQFYVGADDKLGTYNWSNVSGTTTLTTDTWYHVTLTRDASNIKLYLNGIFENQTTSLGVDPGTTMYIGQFSGGGNYYFHGLIDDVKVYNYARTPTQILEDMAGGGSKQPLVYLKFDEGYGSKVNNLGNGGIGLSGGLGTGTSAPTWNNNGKYGKALKFDGSNDIVTIPDTNSLSFIDSSTDTPFTLSAWIDFTSGNGGEIISKNDLSLFSEYRFNISNGKLGLILDSMGGQLGALTANSVSQNVWHHVVTTYDGSKNFSGIKMYIDGIGQSLTTNNSGSYLGMPNSDANVYIGARSNAGDPVNAFAGYIDEVRIYNYPLTTTEVKTEYNQNSTVQLGSLSSDTGSTASNNASSQAYCLPGDTSTCRTPVAEWKLNENQGTIIQDTSGSGYTGAFAAGSSAPTWTIGKNGSALKFDGVNDYVSAANVTQLAGASQFTIGLWIKANTKAEWKTFISKFFNASNNIGVQLGGSGGGSQNDINISFMNANSSQCFTTSAFVQTQTWYHLEVVYNGGGTTNTDKLKLYVNGIGQSLTCSGTITATATTENANTVIGRESDQITYFDGIVDDVRIYDYARTPAQAAWDYNLGGPIGWWKFDECQGSTAFDSSGLGYTGTIIIDAGGTQTSLGTCNIGATDAVGNQTVAWKAGSSGKYNSSMSFDGYGDYVDLGDPTNLKVTTGDVSLSAWFNIRANNLPSQHSANIIGRENISSSITRAIQLEHLDSGYLQFELFDGTNNPYIRTSYSLVGTGWHHAVGVRKGGGIYLYIDGKLYDSAVDSSVNLNSGDTLGWSIGKRKDSSYFGFFNGLIDDVRIYSYGLTATQIKTLYNGGAVNFR
jgi:hypothetical protein